MSSRLLSILVFLLIIQTVKTANILPLDSVLKCVMEAAEVNHKKIKTYDADVYMRALVVTKKKNFLYPHAKSIPNFVIYDSKNDKAVIETVSKIRFEAPNNYFQDINYVTGTLTRKNDIALLPLKFMSIDIYKESDPGENFFLPLHKKSSIYYEYMLVSVNENDGHKLYTIRYTPIYKNPQLLSGYFVVEDETWRVIDFNGKRNDLFVNHSFDIHIGSDSLNNLLPVSFTIYQSYKYLGNHVVNTFHASLNYTNVIFNENEKTSRNYHLGVAYRVKLDSVPVNNDTLLWEKIRTFPLTQDEAKIIDDYKIRQAGTEAKNDASDSKDNMALGFAKNMVLNTRYKYKSASFRYSGLLNPTMLGYSTVDGFSYKQSLNLKFDLERQQSIIINAFGGYLFKKKQLYYQLSGVWNYEPLKLGYLSLAVGRGNPTYSSRFLQVLQDTISQELVQNIARYRDQYAKLLNSIEIANGFQLDFGIDYHVRIPIRSGLAIQFDEQPLLRTQFNFMPKVSISWTPEQYYHTDGFQKVNVRADFPTFKIEFAQSIPGVLRSHSSFNRLEFDISQNIRFDLMRRLNYHLGVGVFANQKDEYFNDFTYFAKNYFPETWGDGIGGGFNLLPSDIYNSSEMYAQGHFMYESPSLLLTRLPFLANGVACERIYLSQLYLPYKESFTEIGYGIGNRFFNAAVFIAYDKMEYYSVGGKAVFLF